MKEKFDKLEAYCPKLGHGLNFKYCRSEKNGLPCSRLPVCWFEKLPVENYLRANYSEEELKACFTPPQDRACSLVELIEKAKKRI